MGISLSIFSRKKKTSPHSPTIGEKILNGRGGRSVNNTPTIPPNKNITLTSLQSVQNRYNFNNNNVVKWLNKTRIPLYYNNKNIGNYNIGINNNNIEITTKDKKYTKSNLKIQKLSKYGTHKGIIIVPLQSEYLNTSGENK